MLDESGTNKGRDLEAIQLYEIMDVTAQDIFKWHLDRCILQIKSFGKISMSIITSFYGDMHSNPNQESCMYNLMISEIFMIRKQQDNFPKRQANITKYDSRDDDHLSP